MPFELCPCYCDDAAAVRAAIILAVGSMRVGSHIDVFRDNCFWEAEIVRVFASGFRYRFLHTGRQREYGWVVRRDFLKTWRFPVRDDFDVSNAKLVAEFGQDAL